MNNWIAFLAGAWAGSTVTVAVIAVIAWKYRDRDGA